MYVLWCKHNNVLVRFALKFQVNQSPRDWNYTERDKERNSKGIEVERRKCQSKRKFIYCFVWLIKYSNWPHCILGFCKSNCFNSHVTWSHIRVPEFCALNNWKLLRKTFPLQHKISLPFYSQNSAIRWCCCLVFHWACASSIY